MDTGVIVAIVTGLFTLIGTVITVYAGNKKISNDLDKHNAVQDERIAELTREVRKHNEFAERIPVLEVRVDHLEHKSKGE